MPKLGDYLGQLLSEIAMARMQADLETIRLAELYAAHPLLRTMPVPHVRLPEVELDVPILVDDSEAPRPGESSRGGIVLAEVSKKFDELFGVHLGKAGLTMTAAERKRLRASVDERLAAFRPDPETSIDVNQIADELSDVSIEAIRGLKPRPEMIGQPVFPAQAAREFKDEVRRELLKLRSAPPRLAVFVTSSELRESGTPDNLTRLRLKVTEQGVEWTTVETDGVRHDRLVPE